jgi:hypothetical protein
VVAAAEVKYRGSLCGTAAPEIVARSRAQMGDQILLEVVVGFHMKRDRFGASGASTR